jgi:hypothetical protein
MNRGVSARDHRTGRNLQDFGPFFVGNLVAVGCRVMGIGRRLATLLGTPISRIVAKLEPRQSARGGQARSLFAYSDLPVYLLPVAFHLPTMEPAFVREL